MATSNTPKRTPVRQGNASAGTRGSASRPSAARGSGGGRSGAGGSRSSSGTRGAPASGKRPAAGGRGGTRGPGGPGRKGTGGRNGRNRRRGLWWKTLLAMLLAGLAMVSGLLVTAYVTTDIPAPDDFAQAQTTQVYYADGSPMGEFSEFAREPVELASLPEHLPHAIVASEDRRFYDNAGVDLRGILRALWNNVRGLPTQGGSTITQQYVERYYLGTTTSLPGKFREAILAVKISNELSKEQVLESYMNTIYFGRGAYGIEVAAQNYFGKPAAELSLSESALIAGIIPSPSRWDPAVAPDRAEQRWNRVLDLMVEDGWITAEDRAAQTFPAVIEYVPTDTFGGTTGYLLAMVRDELVARAGISAAEIDTAGLKITTTIDPAMQQAALEAVASLPEEGRAPNTRMGLVAMDPGTGAVRAAYGGPDYLAVPRNAVAQDRAQMGSTAKPFGLIAALENGASLGDRYPSHDDMEIPGYDFPVSNYDSRDRGEINLVDALRESVNTVSVQLNVEYGPEATRDVMIRAGLSENTPSLDPVPSNVLGAAAATPWDMVRAYGTIAAVGEKHDPYLVEHVEDRDGRSRYQATQVGERVFSEDVMAKTIYAMQQVVIDGTGERAALPDRPVAGKTGSSNNYRSAWFAGFVPQLVAVVDMYQPGPNGEEEVITPFGEFAQISGGSFPAMVWHEFMVRATAGMEVLQFPDPGDLDLSRPAPPAPIEEPTTEEPGPEEPTEEPAEEKDDLAAAAWA
ncbi:MAG: transglycosylase domain-containing protein [bacterium]|nr:transglycosylase domain-containing protein [bacterium]